MPPPAKRGGSARRCPDTTEGWIPRPSPPRLPTGTLAAAVPEQKVRRPKTTAGWAGRGRPSPTVIPLGKGEYSLRESLVDSFSGDETPLPQLAGGSCCGVANTVVGAAEQALDAATERGHRNDGDNGDEANEQTRTPPWRRHALSGRAQAGRRGSHAPRKTRSETAQSFLIPLSRPNGPERDCSSPCGVPKNIVGSTRIAVP